MYNLTNDKPKTRTGEDVRNVRDRKPMLMTQPENKSRCPV